MAALVVDEPVRFDHDSCVRSSHRRQSRMILARLMVEQLFPYRAVERHLFHIRFPVVTVRRVVACVLVVVAEELLELRYLVNVEVGRNAQYCLTVFRVAVGLFMYF